MYCTTLSASTTPTSNTRWLVATHIRVHRLDLFPGWGTEHLDNLHQLVDARLAREERLSEHQLGHDAASGPDV
jgi:hypothetical protein